MNDSNQGLQANPQIHLFIARNHKTNTRKCNVKSIYTRTKSKKTKVLRKKNPWHYFYTKI